MQVEQKKPSGWMLVAGIFGALAIGAVVGGIYWLASGKPPKEGMLLTIFTMPVLMVLMNRFMRDRRELRIKEIPPPLLETLRKDLETSGLSDLKLAMAEGSDPDYPRPVATGRQVSLSPRLIDEMSPPALSWFVRTEGLASWEFSSRFALLFFLLMLTALAVMGLSERIGWPWWSITMAVFTFVAPFASMIWIDLRLQFKADKRLTVTESDRSAAKEALSFAYFEQADRPKYNRWFYFRSELAARAKRLGIELERGHRADAKTNAPPLNA